MITSISLTHALSAHDMKRENSQAEIMEFIIELDGAVAEADFTTRLILRLATDLAGDSKSSEMKRIGSLISKMEGYEP